MIMNVHPLQEGILCVKLEGTADTIDAFMYDILFRTDSVRLLTAEDTRDALDKTEDCRETMCVLAVDMDEKHNATTVA